MKVLAYCWSILDFLFRCDGRLNPSRLLTRKTQSLEDRGNYIDNCSASLTKKLKIVKTAPSVQWPLKISIKIRSQNVSRNQPQSCRLAWSSARLFEKVPVKLTTVEHQVSLVERCFFWHWLFLKSKKLSTPGNSMLERVKTLNNFPIGIEIMTL